MTDRVAAVLFDVDDTLCAYRRPAAELLELAFEAVGVEPFFPAAEYYARYGEFVDDADSVEEIRERCFAALAEERGRDPSVGRAVAAAYAAERDHGNVRPLPGVCGTLAALEGRYRLGVVTNGSPTMQAAKLDALGLTETFEVVIHGGYDAPAKPAPEPFDRALDTLGVAAERAVHVGNSPSADVAGARAAGVRATWLRRGGRPLPAPLPDYVVESVAALRDPPWTA